MKQYCCHWFLSTCGTTINSDTIYVHIRVLLGSGFYPGNMIGQSGIFQILVTYVFESAWTERSSHPIYHDNNKTEFGNTTHKVVIRNKGFGYVLITRSLIDILQNGVFFVRIKIAGTNDDSPHIRFSVTTFGGEYFGSFPAFSFQTTDISRFKWHDDFSVFGIPEYGYRSFVYPRIYIN